MLSSLPIVLSFFLSLPLSRPSVSPRGSETESVSPTISALLLPPRRRAAVRSLASTQRRFLPALRHRHSLSFNRHHANLSLSPSLSPLSLFLSLSSSHQAMREPAFYPRCRRRGPIRSAPRFSSATPNQDSSDGCETGALPESLHPG